jgi:hypothetical protein
VADLSIRSRAVQAFDGAAAAAAATGDRHLQEEFGRLAVEMRHHDTSEETLTALLAAFATTTEESHDA